MQESNIKSVFFYSKLISSNIIMGEEDTWVLNSETAYS